MRQTSCIVFGIIATAFSTAAFAETGKKLTKATEPGPARFEKGILVDPKGMTLYTFDKDTVGSDKSACNQGCIEAWPAFKAASDAKSQGNFKLITRDDGSKQWAYKGKPLYLWVNDKKAGDTTGDKFQDVWHVVKEK